MLVAGAGTLALFGALRRSSTFFDALRRSSTLLDTLRRFSTLFDALRHSSTLCDALRRASTRFSVVVRNVGKVPGDVVVTCFVAAVGRPDAPLRELFDFARVRDLAPAASTNVTMELRPRSLSLVDAAGVRSTTAGAYDVRCSAGRVADTEDIRLTVD